MSRPSVARSGVIVLIAVTVGLWLTAAPVAAGHAANDDGGLGFHAGPDGVHVGDNGGIAVDVQDPGGTGSIDGGGGGGGLDVRAGGEDGFGGGGGLDDSSVGTQGVEIDNLHGGGSGGPVSNAFDFSLDVNNDGTVDGDGGGSLTVAGNDFGFECEFTEAGPGECGQTGGGEGAPIPNPGEGAPIPNPGEGVPGPVQDVLDQIQGAAP